MMQTGGGGDARGSVVKSEFDEAYFQQVYMPLIEQALSFPQYLWCLAWCIFSFPCVCRRKCVLLSREVVVGLRTWQGDQEDSTPILQQRLVPVYRTRTLLVSLVRLEGENPGRNIIIETRKKRSREYTMHEIFVQIDV